MTSTEKSNKEINSVPYFKSGFNYGRKSKIQAKLKSEETDIQVRVVVESETLELEESVVEPEISEFEESVVEPEISEFEESTLTTEDTNTVVQTGATQSDDVDTDTIQINTGTSETPQTTPTNSTEQGAADFFGD